MRNLQAFLAPLALNNLTPQNVQGIYTRYNNLNGNEKLLLSRYVTPEVLERVQSNRANVVAQLDGGDIAALRAGLNAALTPYISPRQGAALLMEKLLMTAGSSVMNANDIINNPDSQAYRGLLKYVTKVKQELDNADDAKLTRLLESNDIDTQKRIANVLAKYSLQLAAQAYASEEGVVPSDAAKKQDIEGKFALLADIEKDVWQYRGDIAPNSPYMTWQTQLKRACEAEDMTFWQKLSADLPQIKAKSGWLNRLRNAVAGSPIKVAGLYVASMATILFAPAAVPAFGSVTLFVSAGVVLVSGGLLLSVVNNTNALLDIKDIGILTLLSAAFLPTIAPFLGAFFILSSIVKAVSIVYTGLKEGVSWIASCALGACSIVESAINVFIATLDLCARAILTIPCLFDRDSLKYLWSKDIRSLTNDPNGVYNTVKNVAYNSTVTAVYQGTGFDLDPEVQKARVGVAHHGLEKQFGAIALQSIQIDNPPNVPAPVVPAQAKTFVQRLMDSVGIGEGQGKGF